MKVGIVGFHGGGKTSVFSLLSGLSVPPHARAERHVAMVDVIDRRLDKLADLWKPKKFTRARFEVEDWPALPREAVKGKAETVALLREVDALLLVVGIFDEASASLPADWKDPARHLRALADELLLFDLESVEKRIHKLEDRIKKNSGDRVSDSRTLDLLKRVEKDLADGRRVTVHDKEEQRQVDELRLFTEKPRVVVFNVDEDQISDASRIGQLKSIAEDCVVLCSPIELEIGQLEGPDRAAFLKSYGLEEPARERLTRQAHHSLDLIAFFTMGEDEVRAWPIVRGSDAVTAAGKIHTDLSKGFIRAEVIPFEHVANVSSVKELKAQARPEVRGRDYVVRDGDILNIRHNS